MRREQVHYLLALECDMIDENIKAWRRALGRMDAGASEATQTLIAGLEAAQGTAAEALMMLNRSNLPEAAAGYSP